MAILAVRRLSFAIAGQTILENVSFELDRGEFVAIVGPNGAGKTTLLRCLALVYRNWQGEILWLGRPAKSVGQREWARFVAYLPQEERVDIPYTVEDFVLMGRYPHGSPFSPPSSQDIEAVREALELTGTWSFRHRVVRTLSGGERQRVMLAAVLAQQTPVLLLDEATTFLDFRHREEVQRLLEKINTQRQVAILAVTHDVNTAALFSHRIVALRDGQVIFDGPPATFMQESILQKVFGFRPLLVAHPHLGIPVIVPTRGGGES
ncbi:MAG: ABC transporter ATP-binding protein [Thermogutta sp.]|jgi:iron complex transport system ATP-binding protein|nr:ABC transporter ATP-binding protein [Thermogutta terrifontis]